MERLDPVAETRLLDAAGRAGKFFMGRADVLRALEKVSRLLEEDGVDYALVGALALNEHGYERSTAGVDLLLTPHGLAMFKERHVSRGYLEKFPGSRGLLDVENRVPIDVVLAGEFPGDGKPKPVRFPDPAAIARGGAKLRVVPLVTLVELKLASGISAPHRLRDLADVLELVRAAALSGARGRARPLCARQVSGALARRARRARRVRRARVKTALVLVVALSGAGPWLAFEGERTARAQQSAGVLLSVGDALTRIQRVYGNAITFTADFEQRFLLKSTNQSTSSRGHIEWRTPGNITSTLCKSEKREEDEYERRAEGLRGSSAWCAPRSPPRSERGETLHPCFLTGHP